MVHPFSAVAGCARGDGFMSAVIASRNSAGYNGVEDVSATGSLSTGAIGANIKLLMSATIDQESAEAIELKAQSSGDLDLAEAMRQDLTNYNGGSIVFGIMLAGGAYPIVLAAIYLIVGLAFVIWNSISGYPLGNLGEEIGAVFVFLVAGGVFCAFIGVVWAAIASALDDAGGLPVFAVAPRARKLCRIGSRQRWACGLRCVFANYAHPALVGWPVRRRNDCNNPCRRSCTYHDSWPDRRSLGWTKGRPICSFVVRESAAAAIPDLSAESSSTDEMSVSSNAAEPRLQFSIRHLLWIFVWLSLILSVIKLCRLPFEFVLPVLVGWFFYQLATLRIGSYLARRLGPWWGKWRGRRST